MQPRADAAAALLRWWSSGERGAGGEFLFPAGLAVFRGHFPGRALVPGVYLLATVVELAAQARGERLEVVAVERAKWSAPALPEVALSVQVSWQERAHGLLLEGAVHAGATVVASCRIVVVSAAAPR
jgi:3-hydroxymyristoyl/3-hydroxydecanoyl-(acyl carrier protein) dehydratase